MATAQVSIPDLDDGVLGEMEKMERRQMNLGKSLGNITRKYHGYMIYLSNQVDI
jgi:hypothetical protein